MSYDYNYKFWIATTEELPDLFAKEELIAKKEPDERLEKHDNFAELYAFYVNLYNRLTYLYEKTYQIQKSTVIQKLLESTTYRVLELRNELKNLEFSEFIYVDKILMQRKIVPSEIQILLPTYFPFFRPREIQEELDIDDDYNIYQDIKNKTPPRLIPIITIQSHERAKKARLLLFLIKSDPKTYLPKPSAASRFKYEFMHKENQAMLIPMKRTRFEGEYYASRTSASSFKYYESPARRKGGLIKQISGSEDMFIPKLSETFQWPEHYEEEFVQEAESVFTYFSSSSKESYLFLHDLAVRKIQSAWHWYKFRKHLQKIKMQEGVFLGMIFPRKVSRNRYEEMSKFRKYRRRRQEMFEQQFLKACEDEKTRILKLRGPTIMEDISDHIRYWFKEFYLATGDFHPYPDPVKGGTILLLKGNTMTLQEFIQKQQEKDKGKDKKKEGKKDKDEDEGKKKKSKLGKYALELKNTLWQYEVDYVHIDEKNNVKEEPYIEWVKEGVLVDIHKELRAIVDELMIIEFELLREALALDSKTAYKPQKRKKPKKGKKKKKEVDLTEGKSFRDLFDEMLAAGLIRKYKPKTFDDFIGDLSYCAYEVRNYFNLDGDPSKGEIKSVLREWVLGMGAINFPKVKSLLIAGPRFSGKNLLIDIVATELDAVIIDISPEVVFKYEEDMDYLIFLLNKMARLLQPTIFYIRDAHRLFWKKIPPEVDYNPALMSQYIQKFILKPIKKEEKIILIGTSELPWDGKPAQMKKTFERTILLPKPDYGTGYLLWRSVLLSIAEIPPNWEISPLTKVTNEFSSGVVYRSVSDTVKLERRMKLATKKINPYEFIEAFVINNSPDVAGEQDFTKYTKWWLKTDKFAAQREKMLIELKLAASKGKK